MQVENLIVDGNREVRTEDNQDMWATLYRRDLDSKGDALSAVLWGPERAAPDSTRAPRLVHIDAHVRPIMG